MTRYRSDADAAREAAVALELERAWRCEVHPFPPLSPVDWYACRGDAVVAYLELKCRNHDVDTFGTVYLSVRKWLALQLVDVAHGVPALFVVRWRDALRWVRAADVGGKVMVAGTNGNGHGRNGVEPVLLVPVEDMHDTELAG